METRAEFVCPSCRATISAPVSLAGSTAPCPRCRVEVAWSAPPLREPERALQPGRKWEWRWPWVVGCALVVAVFVVGIVAFQLGMASQRGVESPAESSSHNGKTPSAGGSLAVIESGRELRRCADGEEVTVRGKVGIVLTTEEWLIGKAVPPPATITPFTELTLADGARLRCSFGDVTQDKLDAWRKKNPPGTIVTVRGAFQGGDFPIVGPVELLPDGFR